MLEPAQIGFVEGAEIRDAIFQHRHPLDPHPEGKALIFAGIDAAIAQYLRVHHAAAENFEPIPTGANLQFAALSRAADIDLGRGLGEREIARPETHRQILDIKKGAAELDQTAFQMAHMGRPVDHQPLDLMEHRRMRRVVIGTEGAARDDDADRRRLRQHRADLHRRGVGAQHEARAVRALRQIECVVLLTRGVFGRDVQRREIVKILLDMRPLGDDEPHLAKDRDDLVDRLADRVNAAGLARLHRQGDIGALAGKLCGARRAAEPIAGFGERSRDHVLHGIQRSTGFAPRFGRERAEATHQFGQTAAPPERGDADRLKRVRRLRSADLAEDLVAQAVCFFHQRIPKKKGAVMRPLRSQRLSGASAHPSPGKSRNEPNALHLRRPLPGRRRAPT